MTVYKTFVTIESEQIVISNLPFQKGQRVKVVFLSEDGETSPVSQRFRSLFKETQSLPGVSEITEEEIAAEITAYRQGE